MSLLSFSPELFGETALSNPASASGAHIFLDHGEREAYERSGLAFYTRVYPD
jgi:hypothetical protein